MAEDFDFGKCERLWGHTLSFAFRAVEDLGKSAADTAPKASLSGKANLAAAAAAAGDGDGFGGAKAGVAEVLPAVLAACVGPYIEFQRR